jgi:hypothetical protein
MALMEEEQLIHEHQLIGPACQDRVSGVENPPTAAIHSGNWSAPRSKDSRPTRGRGRAVGGVAQEDATALGPAGRLDLFWRPQQQQQQQEAA